ncbi:PAS domain-containing sensor histidine kinase [Occallatibacter savannae]|uniref:PAS domain-containing sensor histidine kinase n=1 Tax=Occallatibacter savannae TaxID=1002691 RepID=UPI00194DF73C|nr:PAS domain S-box protein [Occallatibacter savannae]
MLQIAKVALSCAKMCAWDWDIQQNKTIYFGDPIAIFGGEPDAEYVTGFRSHVHPADIDSVETKIQALCLSKTVEYEDEFRVLHADGSTRWIYARGKFSYDPAGTPINLLGVNVDISEHKARDQKLDEARSAILAQHTMLDTIINNIPVMICYMREPGKVQWVNRAWTSTIGWSPEENNGDTAALLYPDPEELAKVRSLIAEADGEARDFKTRTKSGDIIDTKWLNVALPDGTNIGIGRDVTAENKAARELRDVELRFQALSENIPQMVWITDPAGATLYQNGRWYAYTGQTPEHGLGFNWREFIHPDDFEPNQRLWEQANQNGVDYENELRIRGRDGEYRWFLVRGTPIRGEDGAIQYWFGTNTDITEKKLAQEALLRAEKLAVAGRFAATVAHEVNNPLTAVTNIHYVLSLTENLPENVRELLHTADNELRRVSHILRQTLAFYRENSPKEHVRLLPLMDEVLAIFGRRLESRSIRLELDIPAGIQFLGSSGEIRQVLCNLVGNALDASSHGDRIVVRARRISTDDSRSRINISVADSGSGIARENLKKIFEPFFTSKVGVGTGLGLWVSKQLVERNAGTIRVRSRVGQGTVFRLSFPQGESSL